MIDESYLLLSVYAGATAANCYVTINHRLDIKKVNSGLILGSAILFLDAVPIAFGAEPFHNYIGGIENLVEAVAGESAPKYELAAGLIGMTYHAMLNAYHARKKR